MTLSISVFEFKKTNPNEYPARLSWVGNNLAYFCSLLSWGPFNQAWLGAEINLVGFGKLPGLVFRWIELFVYNSNAFN